MKFIRLQGKILNQVIQKSFYTANQVYWHVCVILFQSINSRFIFIWSRSEVFARYINNYMNLFMNLLCPSLGKTKTM